MPRNDTHKKIEDAAIALFAENGYKGTSTRRIAKEAGVSELTIYRCYKTKGELFRQALLKQAPDKWLKSIEPNPSQPIEEQLLQLCVTIYHTLTERQHLIRIFYRDADEHPEIIEMVREIPSKIWKPVSDYLQKIKPNLSETILDLLASQLYNAYLGLVIQMIFFGKESIPFSIKQYHNFHAETYAQVLKEKAGRE